MSLLVILMVIIMPVRSHDTCVKGVNVLQTKIESFGILPNFITSYTRKYPRFTQRFPIPDILLLKIMLDRWLGFRSYFR